MGIEPHCNSDTGLIVGDRNKLHVANIETLKNAQRADLQHKQVELASFLEVEPTRVIIERGGRGNATVTHLHFYFADSNCRISACALNR